jgi:subfamily B ATP-binding cassette protein HlyB/CyaB
MPAATNQMKARDPGIVILGLFPRLHGIAAKVEQIRQRCRTANIGIPAILNWAKKFGLIAPIEPADWERLAAVQLLAVATRRDGSFLLIAKSG